MTRKSTADCNKSEAKDSKMDHSASSSCTSSSISTSGDENMENLLGDDQRVVEETQVKNPNEKPEFHDHNEPKETAFSDSPSSSCVSNFSNSRPKQALVHSKSPEATIPQLGDLDDGKTDIPSDFDVDFWELMDSLDPLQSNETAEKDDTNLFITEEKTHGEVEFSMWLRFFEKELGLTSDGDHLPKDQHMMVAANPQYQEMSFEPEINTGFDYSPMWPSSPHFLGI